jgi:DNA-binding MarR family transcriptional regulator
MLWEVLFNQDLGEHGAVAEKMIAEQPTVSELEEIAEKAGLFDVKTHSASEVFEFENGQEFIASQLVSEFLLPAWLETLDEKENKQVADGLARLIDDEDGSLSFRFTVKATLVTGARV